MVLFVLPSIEDDYDRDMHHIIAGLVGISRVCYLSNLISMKTLQGSVTGMLGTPNGNTASTS